MARTITVKGETLTLSPDQDSAVTQVLAALQRPKSEATLAGAAGCITGDAEIIVNRAGKGFRCSLGHVVKMFNGGTASGRRWDQGIPTFVQVCSEEGTGRKGRLRSALVSGEKEVFTLTDSKGRCITATADHPFLTPDGWKQLQELGVGSTVYRVERLKSRGRGKKSYYHYTWSMQNHPYVRSSSYTATRRNRGGKKYTRQQHRVATHRLVAEARENGLTLFDFKARIKAGEIEGLSFLGPELHVHHINGDTRDNSPANLSVMGSREHHQAHSKVNQRNVLWRQVGACVLSIEPAGQQMTYDLSLVGEPHNFTANGFVVHNTGKTTVMNAILNEWKGGVLFMAPTGKAANRLAEQTGHAVRTIHSSIFKTVSEDEGGDSRREVLVFGEPDTPVGCGATTLVVVDEASMVGVKLATTLREVVFMVGGRILWVGDHEQLPPVDGVWGARLDRPTARLTQVHRQALESDVLYLATLIRERRAGTFDRWGDDVQRIRGATIAQAVEWSEEGRAVDVLLEFGQEKDRERDRVTRVLLTWTNKVRTRANSITREVRNYPREEVVAGETLICTFNNHSLGKMNGEIVEVSEVEPCEELSECLGVRVQWVTEQRPIRGMSAIRTTRFLVIPSTFDRAERYKSDRQVHRNAWKLLWARQNPRNQEDENVYALLDRMGWSWSELNLWRSRAKKLSLQATWGYCLTVHKSQGSSWTEVGFISCPSFRSYEDRDFKRRLSYTSVTRAEERFIAFMLGG